MQLPKVCIPNILLLQFMRLCMGLQSNLGQISILLAHPSQMTTCRLALDSYVQTSFKHLMNDRLTSSKSSLQQTGGGSQPSSSHGQMTSEQRICH